MYINFVLLIFSIVFSVTARANPQDQLSHALTSFEQAKYAIALEQLEKLSRNNSDPDINFYLARSLFKDRQFKKAREILENNIKHHPGHADSHYLLGTVKLSLIREVSIFKKPGMAKSALSAWQAAVAADEKHVESRYAVASYLMNAPGLVGGNKKKGIDQLQILEKLSQPYFHLASATVNISEKKFKAAEVSLKIAIEGIPERGFPSIMLANLYLEQKRPQEALSVLQAYRGRARAWNDPDEAQTGLLAGRIYAALEDTSMAETEFNLALQSNPQKNVEQQIQKALKAL